MSWCGAGQASIPINVEALHYCGRRKNIFWANTDETVPEDKREAMDNLNKAFDDLRKKGVDVDLARQLINQ